MGSQHPQPHRRGSPAPARLTRHRLTSPAQPRPARQVQRWEVSTRNRTGAMAAASPARWQTAHQRGGGKSSDGKSAPAHQSSATASGKSSAASQHRLTSPAQPRPARQVSTGSPATASGAASPAPAHQSSATATGAAAASPAMANGSPARWQVQHRLTSAAAASPAMGSQHRLTSPAQPRPARRRLTGGKRLTRTGAAHPPSAHQSSATATGAAAASQHPQPQPQPQPRPASPAQPRPASPARRRQVSAGGGKSGAMARQAATSPASQHQSAMAAASPALRQVQRD